ncbi:MAG: phosphoglycolate phosphatase [Rhodothermales bacterium]|jgi:phosphoglycolate phosphatase
MNDLTPKNILLDLDGTLTDPFLGISRCVIYAIEQQGFPAPNAASLRSWIGPPLLQNFVEYFESVGGGDADQALIDYRLRFSEKGLFENTVYDGIPLVLDTLKQAGHQLFLATAKPIIYARRIVEHFGLDRYLVNAYGAELDGTRTDKVDLLQYILDEENLDASRCMMIGDRKHDMIGARYHSIQAIGVLWGYGSEAELLEAGADRLVRNPGELLEVLAL